MAMNSSGPISLGGATAGQSINLENGFSATAQVSLNDTAVRNLAGVASGAITMPTDFYGKSNIVNISYTFTTNTANATLDLSTISGYSAGKSVITVTINSGVYLYSTSTGGYGLNLSGGTTGDTLTVVNNGFILGQGGAGTPGTQNLTPAVGGSGGSALNLNFGMTSCTINNTNASAYIAGGGGGGAGGVSGGVAGGGGGGAGGGGAGNGSSGSTAGTGGGVGASGTNGSNFGGGGGGRILPGSGGGSVNGGYGYGGGAGGGGGGATVTTKATTQTSGGSGGSANGAGGAGPGTTVVGAGGGGGWGSSGGRGGVSVNGGPGGKAVNLNSKTVTWTSGDTTRVYGAVS